ncbi:MAG: SMC-Scp complex subunit ScpB [Parcubacteria group bacterium]|nr:SMC-Scp complex subunit ScpB [Parcubacteria group bacterium]
MELAKKIEAILFHKAEPLTLRELARLLNVGEKEIEGALSLLESSLTDRGISLLRKDDEVMFATAPEMSSLIEKINKEELSKDLGKASLETLTIILYRGPLSRSDIDYIRGVNSSFILRSLLVRGLIERIPNPEGARSFLYRPTFDLLAHLGVAKVEELPEYAVVREEMEAFEKTQGVNQASSEEGESPKSEEV